MKMTQNSGHLKNDELEANVQRFKFLDTTQKLYRSVTTPVKSLESTTDAPRASSRDNTYGNPQFRSSVPTWEELIAQMTDEDTTVSNKTAYHHNHSPTVIRQAVKVLNKKLEMTNRQLYESQRNKELLTLRIQELEDRLKANGVRLPGQATQEDYAAKTMERLKELATECARREKRIEDLEEQERFLRVNLSGTTEPGIAPAKVSKAGRNVPK